MTDFAEEKLWWSAMQQLADLDGWALATLVNRWFPHEGMPIVEHYGRAARYIHRSGTFVPLSMEDRRVIEAQLSDPLGEDEDIGDLDGLNAWGPMDEDVTLSEADATRLTNEEVEPC